MVLKVVQLCIKSVHLLSAWIFAISNTRLVVNSDRKRWNMLTSVTWIMIRCYVGLATQNGIFQKTVTEYLTISLSCKMGEAATFSILLNTLRRKDFNWNKTSLIWGKAKLYKREIYYWFVIVHFLWLGYYTSEHSLLDRMQTGKIFRLGPNCSICLIININVRHTSAQSKISGYQKPF